jgi:hypothetical protein
MSVFWQENLTKNEELGLITVLRVLANRIEFDSDEAPT